MENKSTFAQDQLKIVDDAVLIAEELVSNYFKMSSAQWLRSRYDVLTLKILKMKRAWTVPLPRCLAMRAGKKMPALVLLYLIIIKYVFKMMPLSSCMKKKKIWICSL